jgi:hypothetical protein
MNKPVTPASPGNLKLQVVKKPSVLKVILKSLWMNETVKIVTVIGGGLSSGLIYPLAYHSWRTDHTDYLAIYFFGLAANIVMAMGVSVVRESLSRNYHQVFKDEFEKLNPGARRE